MKLTVPEAAARIGRSPETVRRWIRAGRLPAEKVGTQHVIEESHLVHILGPASGGDEPSPQYVANVPARAGSGANRLRKRITVTPGVLAGKPVIRGTRISVEFVLDLLAAGWSEAEILDNYPGLAADDIRACLAYASESVQSERVYMLPFTH